MDGPLADTAAGDWAIDEMFAEMLAASPELEGLPEAFPGDDLDPTPALDPPAGLSTAPVDELALDELALELPEPEGWPMAAGETAGETAGEIEDTPTEFNTGTAEATAGQAGGWMEVPQSEDPLEASLEAEAAETGGQFPPGGVDESASGPIAALEAAVSEGEFAAPAAATDSPDVAEPDFFDFFETAAAEPEAVLEPPMPDSAGAPGMEGMNFDSSDEMLRELLDSEEGRQLLASLQQGSSPDTGTAPEEPEDSGSSAALPAEESDSPRQAGLEELIGSIDEGLERAAPLSGAAEQPAAVHKQFSQLDDYVVFSLSGGDYALPVRDVAEIGRVPGVTKVPNVPEFVRGITNLRGEIVPVLNLPVLLGLQELPSTARGRVLFLQAREPVAAAGLLVDEVKGIQRIPSQQLEHVGGLVDDKVTSVLRGVHGRGDRLLNILDLEQVFRLEEFQRFERR
ncbi:MAG: chemotaxis protein CheW [Bryobacteraceae bacterium]|nr:chemotaxis protein CheW [Bryobacteraceae bacterium]